MRRSRLSLMKVATAALALALGAAEAPAAVLQWDAVTTNADGTAITDLAGYRIFQSAASLLNKTTQQAMADPAITKLTVAAPATSITLNLAPGSHFFRVTAYDTAGNQSGFNVNSSNMETEVSTTIAAPPPPSVNPIAHWKLDEASGLAASDSSGAGMNGSLSGGAAWTAGQIGGAVSMDGVDDHINVAHASTLNLGGAFTIALWVNPSEVPNAFKSMIVKNYDYFFYAASSGYCAPGAMIAGIATAAGNRIACDSAPLAVSTWTHVAMVYDGAALRIVRNGVQSASIAASGLPNANAGTLQLGASQFGEHLKGRLDDVRIYNRALTISEVQGLMAAPPPPEFSACDANQDSVTNVVDVQLSVNQSLGLGACAADVNKDGTCTVVDVQRIVNAALGGACLAGS